MRRRGHKKFICAMIALFLLVAGMGLKPIQAHSALSNSSKTETTTMTPRTKVLVDTERCTTEMLGIRNCSSIQNSVSESPSKQREMKLSYAVLILSFLYLLERKIFVGKEEIRLYNLFPKKLLVHYIHKSDGRKRTI